MMTTVKKVVSVPKKGERIQPRRWPWQLLSGNIAVDGCIVKTAGVDEENLKFKALLSYLKARHSRRRHLRW
ncbi:dihydroxy-acid dehydratase [Vibrio chagasii]|nr:dihydroxy-acid dehydratase [Vibrio chagasii]